MTTVESSKRPDWRYRLLAFTLIVALLKGLLDVAFGGFLTILQIIIDIILLAMLRWYPKKAGNWIVRRAIAMALFWTMLTYSQSGLGPAIFVGIEEGGISLALLLLAIGNPGTLRRTLAMVILGTFTVGL